MENEIIAGNLLRLRKARKLSQQQVAAAAGISRVGYRKIENRESKPRVDTLKAIATALEVNIRELVTPVRQLSHVRFRSQKTFNTREQILAEIGEKLENYAELESLLNLQIDNRLAKIRLLPKGKKNPQEVADRARKQFKLTADEPIVNICGLLEANGVKVISMRRTSENFFGLSVSALDGGPAVIVNIWERIPVERWIFTAVHELGHLIFHLIAYDVSEVDENKEEEKEADRFASYFLMPQEAFQREWQNTYGLPLSERVLKIKRIFKVSYKTVLFRLDENNPGKNVWKLFYYDYRMQYRKPLSAKELYTRIWRGSFPAVVLDERMDRDLFYASYVQTYLQRDIRDLAKVGDEIAFFRFLRATAARTGQLLNLAELARDADVSPNTAKNWLSILMTSGIVYLLEPYHHNVSKRLVKRPKLYFLDTGLCSYLTEWLTPMTLEAGAMSGAILETWIFSEILKGYWHNGRRAPFYYYRDKDQKEIDLIISQDGVIYPLEFKKTALPTQNDVRHFKTLTRLKTPVGPGGVICLAPAALPLGNSIFIIPVSAI